MTYKEKESGFLSIDLTLKIRSETEIKRTKYGKCDRPATKIGASYRLIHRWIDEQV